MRSQHDHLQQYQIHFMKLGLAEDHIEEDKAMEHIGECLEILITVDMPGHRDASPTFTHFTMLFICSKYYGIFNISYQKKIHIEASV